MAPRATKNTKEKLERARWYGWYSATSYVTSIRFDMGRLGIGDNALPDHVRTALNDLESRLGDWQDTVVYLLDFRRWNLKRLSERDENVAKPRVDVCVNLNQVGNLTVTWEPRGYGREVLQSSAPASDFRTFSNLRMIARRPDNELLFVKQIRSMLMAPEVFPQTIQEFERRVLFACRALTRQVVGFVGQFCDVRQLTDFRFEDSQDGLMRWSIE
jgi:hypothetical protein